MTYNYRLDYNKTDLSNSRDTIKNNFDYDGTITSQDISSQGYFSF